MCPGRKRPRVAAMALLLILDFSNIVHRSFHGYPPMSNAAGEPVQAAYGAGASALRLIEQHRPTHVLAAMDAPRATLRRRALVPDYKDHRGERDDGLVAQLTLAAQVYEAMGIASAEAPGEEADDVAATLACRFPGRVVIATGDRDLLGTCTEDGRVVVHLLGKDIVVDATVCRQLMGVPPGRVADYKALVGDSSDGYAGVRGIGAKGALRLLEEHGDIEALLEAAAAIPGAIGAKLVAGERDARLSLELARLNDSIPMPPQRARFAPSSEGADRLDALELPALARRLRALVSV